MAATLTDAQARLFLEPNYGVVAVLRPDGSPHQTAIWVDWDGDRVVFNLTETRRKTASLRRDPRASVIVFDGDDPYRWVAVSGTCAIEAEGALEHIHALSRKYRGRDYVLPEGEVRLIVRLTPERVDAYRV